MSEIILLEMMPDYLINYKSIQISDSPDLEHYHDSCEIAYFVQADIRLFLKGMQYEIKGGDILFINENDIHKIVYSSNTNYKRYVINFKKSYIFNVLHSVDSDQLLENIKNLIVRKASLNLKNKDEFKRIFEELLEIEKKRSYINDRSIDAVTRLKLSQLLFILDDALKKAQMPVTLHKPELQVQVSNVLNFMDSNYMNKISLDVLEKEFFLSRYRLLHIFKEITGFTVINYLQLRRVIEAQNLLKSTLKGIMDICFSCGFNNIQHFYRVFKKYSRTSPAKYRSSYGLIFRK